MSTKTLSRRTHFEEVGEDSMRQFTTDELRIMGLPAPIRDVVLCKESQHDERPDYVRFFSQYGLVDD